MHSIISGRTEMKGKICILIASTFLFACSNDDDDDTPARTAGSFNSIDYFVVDAGDLERSTSILKGSGSIIFKESLGDILSEHHYDLSFKLESGSSIELITHADNNLSNGASISWSRDNQNVTLKLNANGKSSANVDLKDIDPTEVISYKIDIHNNETPAHILIWRDAEESFSEESALVNSEDGLETPGNGKGNLWGLKLVKAELKGAVLSEAKFED